MPTVYLNTNQISNTGSGFTVSTTGDELVVLPGILVGSTNGSAGILASGAGTSATVHGTVFGGAGIEFTSTGANMHFLTVADTGQILGDIGTQAVSTAANLRVVNNGEISVSGANSFGIGQSNVARTLEVVNHGTISGDIGIRAVDIASITNHGAIIGWTTAIATSTASPSNDTVNNFGTITGAVDMGSGIDVLSNAGTIVGNVVLGADADTYTGIGDGLVTGTINGGLGGDTLTGGNLADTILGGDDNDVIRGNGGIDQLSGEGGNDTIYFSIEDASVNGGAGTGDVAYNTHDEFGLTFDMGANGFEQYFGSAAGETILTSTGTFMIVNARGGNDLVVGSSGGDNLTGGDGDDTLLGGSGTGTDVLVGGSGADSLRGDAGNDTLTGGEGADRFVFNGFDSSVDTITDFTIGVDKIEILRSGFLSPAQWTAGSLDPARFVASANPSPITARPASCSTTPAPGSARCTGTTAPVARTASRRSRSRPVRTRCSSRRPTSC